MNILNILNQLQTDITEHIMYKYKNLLNKGDYLVNKNLLNKGDYLLHN